LKKQKNESLTIKIIPVKNKPANFNEYIFKHETIDEIFVEELLFDYGRMFNDYSISDGIFLAELKKVSGVDSYNFGFKVKKGELKIRFLSQEAAIFYEIQTLLYKKLNIQFLGD
jgi:hypothetical protein